MTMVSNVPDKPKMKGTVHIEVTDQVYDGQPCRWMTLLRWNAGRYPDDDNPDVEAAPDEIEHWLYDGNFWWHMLPQVGESRRESVNVCEAAFLTGLLAL